jgi:HTH-type transcriptional regulator/antitoxin HigA
MVTSQSLHSDLAVPAGEYLAEVIDDLGMRQAELARRMGRPSQTINEIINGSKAVTSETALQLERVTGVPAHIWTGLEEEYRLTLARQHEGEQLQLEADFIDVGLYREMAKLGWVRKVRDKVERVRELLRFFGVASLTNLEHLRAYSPAFRVATPEAASNYALAAWLRKGELEARAIQTQPFNAERLVSCLGDLRKMTCQDPGEWVPKATELLANCGVALVVLPHLPKTYANGATFWVSPTKAVIQLSIRGRWTDIFWFSVFHELAHVLLHGKRYPILTASKDRINDKIWRIQEDEADRFAGEVLVPPAVYEEFVSHGHLTSLAVRAFSERIGVAPGVVVGRLQHDGWIGHHQLNELREQYQFEE